MSECQAASGEAPHENGGDGYLPPDVDTTLLESLFYNEMMMLDDSSDLLSTVTGLVGDGHILFPPPPIFTHWSSGKAAPASTVSVTDPSGKEHSSEDPLTFAEQSLLRDFGVTDSPFPHLSDGSTRDNTAQKSSNHQLHQQQQPALSSYLPQHEHQNQDPDRYPPHQQYHHPPHHYHHPPAGHHYPVNGHPVPQHPYQNVAHGHAPIQPRPSPPPQPISKGIKHSVTAQQPAPAPPPVDPKPDPSHVSVTIPNPLAAGQHQALSPHPHGNPHPQHPPPPYHPHPHHHPGQPAYPYRPLHPSSAPAPSLGPPPVPGHHPQVLYGPPPPHGTAQPPYAAVNPAPHAPHPATGHPQATLPHHHHHGPPPPHTPIAPHSQPHAHAHHHPYVHAQPSKDQLVSQFATLANRLGINLPGDLLASLTKSAGIVSAGGEATTDGPQPPPHHASGPPVAFVQAQHGTDAPRSHGNGTKQSASGEKSSTGKTERGPSPSDSPTPAADDAAITRKRSNEDKASPPGNPQSENNNANKPSYAKRRKKARLSDCESRLAQLSAENEKLRRHLDNVTNQKGKFEQDRIKAEITMKQMMENDETGNEELDAVIREYSEAYSDYGRRRHEELSFHLEQLQKLANPTNFTKMALWTIAKANDSKDISKQNPLIGILQKELNMAPQQVRKILEQRQKIRDLCSNMHITLDLIHQLKEVCEQKNKKFNDRMTKTREILTPKQTVKLIMWIKDYSDLLENICPGWTSEQVVKQEKSKVLTNASANREKEDCIVEGSKTSASASASAAAKEDSDSDEGDDEGSEPDKSDGQS